MESTNHGYMINSGHVSEVTMVKEDHNLPLLRAFLESHHHPSSSKEGDDMTLRRFLRARNQDVEKAGSMYLKYSKWRKSFVPKGYISESEIQDDLAQKKVLLGGVDNKGRPILAVLGRNHFQSPKPERLEVFKRYCVYVLDKVSAMVPGGDGKFIAIGDLKGFGYCNSDVRAYLGAFTILQDCYPERLGKLFIVDAPKLFMVMWKMVYPFIDDNTKKKIEFVDSKQLKLALLEITDESQIPVDYGGKLTMIPIQDA